MSLTQLAFGSTSIAPAVLVYCPCLWHMPRSQALFWDELFDNKYLSIKTFVAGRVSNGKLCLGVIALDVVYLSVNVTFIGRLSQTQNP